MVNGTIPQPLTSTPGNPANGRKVAMDTSRGGCLGCHVMPIPEAPFHGNLGPDLHGVGSRLKPAELRVRIVDAKQIKANSVMPPYYRSTGLNRVSAKWQGKTLLSAQEVEDVVAYLSSLREEDR